MPSKTSNNTTVVRSGGIGFAGALTLLFIGLKLTGFITWPWLWVLAPLWVGLAVALVVIAVVGLLGLLALGIGASIDASQRRKRKAAVAAKTRKVD